MFVLRAHALDPRRIVALGDSFTFGQGVDYGERFTEVLKERHDDLEVINMGACAYGTDQEVLAFETEGSRYESDVVVLSVFLGNDFDDIRAEKLSGWSKPYFLLEHDGLRRVQPEKSWITSLRTVSYLAEVVLQVLERGEASTRRALAWETGDTVPLFHALVRRLRDGVQAQGGQLLVVLVHPSPADTMAYRDVPAARVRGVLEQDGIAVLDTQEALHGSGLPLEQLYLSCHHWTPAGHEIVAAQIAAELQHRGWL